MRLSHASVDTVEDDTETVSDAVNTKPRLHHVYPGVHSGKGAGLRAKVVRPRIVGKAVVRPPDIVHQLRRSSLRERWGLELVHRVSMDTLSLEIGVKSVMRDSVAERAGLGQGHVITRVNDWDVEVGFYYFSISLFPFTFLITYHKTKIISFRPCKFLSPSLQC